MQHLQGTKMKKSEKDKNSNSLKTEEFVELLTANQRKIFAYIMSLVININDADDILQETVKIMWNKFDQFKSGTNFLAWSTTIAYYRILEFRRQKSRNKIIFDDQVFENLQYQALSQTQDSDEYLVYLKHCLNKLKESDQVIIKMRYTNGSTLQQIASQLGRTFQSVHRSICRIQGLLRECINRQIATELRR